MLLKLQVDPRTQKSAIGAGMPGIIVAEELVGKNPYGCQS